MKIVVIGGTGLIGSKTVERLRSRGHEVIAASPNTGINTLTGEGLATALAGGKVVIDLANSPSFEDKAVMDFFETSGRNLLTAGKAAGVEHHIALSVVGTERLQESGYFRAKLAQETLIKASGMPYTIVHSTQFMEFLSGIAQSGTVRDAVQLSPAYVQPIASDDVADVMTDVAPAPPLNGTVEIAGPERSRLSDLVARYLVSTSKAHGGGRQGGALLRRSAGRRLARVGQQSASWSDHIRTMVRDVYPQMTGIRRAAVAAVCHSSMKGISA